MADAWFEMNKNRMAPQDAQRYVTLHELASQVDGAFVKNLQKYSNY